MLRPVSRLLAIAALVTAAPVLCPAQATAPHSHAETYRDHTPRVHDRSPRPHGGATPVVHA